MYAVIKTGGKQYRVQVGDVLDIEKLDIEEGEKVTFGEVLLLEDSENTLIGTPVIDKAQVIGEVIENFKDRKVIVFKKKRRKQYRRTKGHRQLLTKVKIEHILPEGGTIQKEKPAGKKVEPKEEPMLSVTDVKEQKTTAKEKMPEPKKVEKQVKKAVPLRTKPKAPKAAVQTQKTREKKPPEKKTAAGKKKITSKKEK